MVGRKHRCIRWPCTARTLLVAVLPRFRKGSYGSSTKGQLEVASAHDAALGRHTMRAELTRDRKQQVAGTLLDVELGWMAEQRFALSGLYQCPGHDDRPPRLVRQGWLCEFDIEEPADDRPRRKDGSLR